MRTRTRVVAAVASTILLAGTAVGVTTTSASAAKSEPAKVKKVSAVSDKGKYKLSWKKPKGKVKRYQVADRVKKKGGWSSWETKTVKKRKTKVKGKNGTRHQARVRAQNGQGWGKWSKKVKVRIGQPDRVKKVAVAGGKGEVTVSWKKTSGNGAKLTRYTVQTRTDGGKWKGSKAGKKATSKVIKGLGDGQKVDARVRAKNKRGNGPWSKVAKGSSFPKPNPRLTVDASGPYKKGQVITASFTGFPYDHAIIDVAVCAADGRALMGPQDCAPLNGPSNVLATAVNGAGSTKITVPEGALGNTNGPAIDCSDGTNSCALVATTITSDFHMAAPIVLEYARPMLTLSSYGPFDGGESVTATFSGFPGDHPMVAVSVCLADVTKLMELGGAACNFAPGSGAIVSATNGGGSTQLTIPTGMLGIGGEHDVDCRTPNSCAIVASTITSDFHMAMPIIVEYLPV